MNKYLLQNNYYYVKTKQIILPIYKKGFFHLLGANGLMSVFGFMSQMFVAWILKPEELGTIKILQTYGSVLVTLGSLGYNISILKLCSENRNKEEKKYLYQKGLKYSIVGALITYLLIVILSFLHLLSIDNKVNYYMIFFGIGIVPQVINNVYFSYLQALKKIQTYSKIQVFTKIISISVVIILTYKLLINGYIISIIVGYFLTNLFLRMYIKKINSGMETLSIKKSFKLHNKYAFISLVANFISILISSIDILVINYFIKDRVEIGFYSFAVTFVSILLVFSTSIIQITNPYFSEISTDFNNWLNKVKKYDRMLFLISLIVTLISLVVIPLLLRFTFKGKYVNSINYFELLAIAWFFRNMIIIKSSALFGIGKININTLLDIIAVPIYLLSIFVGIYYFNLKGVAISMIISSILFYIIQNLVFNKVISNKKIKACNSLHFI
jgi:O-antigen/teichoic acid export membrane protein